MAAITTSQKSRRPWEASAPPRGTTISLEMGSPALSPVMVTKIATSPPEETSEISQADIANERKAAAC